VQIEQHRIRTVAIDLRECVLAVDRLADDLEAWVCAQ
jgi:hypothetical protein